MYLIKNITLYENRDRYLTLKVSEEILIVACMGPIFNVQMFVCLMKVHYTEVHE